MQNRLILFLFLIGVINGGYAAELTGTLYGISLGGNLDSLNGGKHRQTGTVTIKGVKLEMYLLDVSIYELDPPLSQLMVQVEKNTRKIRGIVAMTQISSEECLKVLNDLKEKIEAINGFDFKELQHQGDSFYIHEEKNIFMSIGCQNKHKTVLQYQIGMSSS